MIQALKNAYKRQLFHPSLLGVFTNPLYFNRRGLHNAVISKSQYLRGRLLDFGCGEKPYKEWLSVAEYVGLDMQETGHDHQGGADVYYDGKRIPFEDGYFDSVLSSEVLEHVFNLTDVLKEIHRVLAPGGHLVITVPFAWEEHEAPFDCARYASFGLSHFLKERGFTAISIEKTTNHVETLFQLWNVYFSQYVLTSRLTRAFFIPLIVGPTTLLGIVLSKLLPRNYNLYLNCIVVAQKSKDVVSS
jgi:SAM-dependent methyltransferase